MTKKSTCLHSFKLTCYKTAFGPSSNYECCFFSSQKSTPVIVGSDVMWCDVMRSSVLLYLHKAACRTFFFFFLCSFPSVFIDRKQPVDIFLLWEKVGVMCITRNTLASIGIIDTDFSAKSAAFRHCHFTLAHITHLHFSLIVFSFSQFASARCLLSQGCTMCLKNIQQLKDVWPSCSSWMIASIPRRSAVRSSGGFKIPRLRCRQRNTT